MSSDLLEDLLTFVSHVQELRQFRFGQKVLARSTVTLRSAGTDQPEFVGLDEEEFRSFLLGCRLLIQNNERISVFNVWKGCEALMGISESFTPINANRWMLNDYLDREAPIVDHNGDSLTNRQILETFLYGSYAHLERAHVARLREWRSVPNQYYPLKLMFILALQVLLKTCGAISEQIEIWISNEWNRGER
jgi:hypothetical protein